MRTSGHTAGRNGELEVFYFGPETRRLFAALHEPRDNAHTAVVFCPSYGDEMVTTYASFARWSKELAQKGFVVFRHHPAGTGESEGAPEKFSVESAVNDAVAAVSYLRERVHLEKVVLFGLRFGALVAARAATVCRADGLIFWSPVVNPRHYLRDLLRLQLTKEMVHQQADQVRITTKSMIEELEAGRSVDIMGRLLGPEFCRHMNEPGLWPDRAPAEAVLWLSRPQERAQAEPLVEDWKKHGDRVEFQVHGEPAFWEAHSSAFARKFAQISSAWLEGMQRGAAGAA